MKMEQTCIGTQDNKGVTANIVIRDNNGRRWYYGHELHHA